MEKLYDEALSILDEMHQKKAELESKMLEYLDKRFIGKTIKLTNIITENPESTITGFTNCYYNPTENFFHVLCHFEPSIKYRQNTSHDNLFRHPNAKYDEYIEHVPLEFYFRKDGEKIINVFSWKIGIGIEIKEKTED